MYRGKKVQKSEKILPKKKGSPVSAPHAPPTISAQRTTMNCSTALPEKACSVFQRIKDAPADTAPSVTSLGSNIMISALKAGKQPNATSTKSGNPGFYFWKTPSNCSFFIVRVTPSIPQRGRHPKGSVPLTPAKILFSDSLREFQSNLL